MILDVNEICSKIDSDLVTFIHNIIVIIKIAVPIFLVIFGMIDLGKGVVANKEDEIKKGQGVFIKRLIAGVIVFFMVTIAQLVMSIADKNGDGQFWTCANGIMNGTAKWTEILENSTEYSDEEEKAKETEYRKCRTKEAQDEYSRCLNYQGQKMCDTIFQEECKVKADNRLWILDRTDTNFIKQLLSGGDGGGTSYAIDCSSNSEELETMYLRSFYSCLYKTTNMNTETCSKYLYPFCKAKNNTDTKKSDCCYEAGGIIGNNGNCIDFDDYSMVKENEGKPTRKTVDTEKYNKCMGN